tara:strand:- start:439 stop:708 length:270 start_codon:yes stop_codon:yes gene_type:complete
MKQFNNDAENKCIIEDIQCNIDEYCTNLETYRQTLRILGSQIGTESFSEKSVEYRNDVESISARIMESNAVLKKSNELLSNLIEAGEEK